MRLDISTTVSRRATAMQAALALFASTTTLTSPLPAVAFENRLPPDELELKYKQPRTPGPQPTDLGMRAGGGLKPCIDGKPHCFSSTPEQFDGFEDGNGDLASAGWLVEPFRYDKPLADALTDVKAAIAAYPPGQRGVDGGGFKVVKEASSADSAYVYVQYESRRKGFIDDMEFALANGVVNVRTSSRLGYLDLGVVRVRPLARATRPLTLAPCADTPICPPPSSSVGSLVSVRLCVHVSCAADMIVPAGRRGFRVQNAKRFSWFADRLGAQKGWKTVPLRSKGHEEYFSLNGLTDKDLS